ncbi:MAG: hypothetical protein Q9166_007648 [cf. Caloplaca sp. 2 TL-2023]
MASSPTRLIICVDGTYCTPDGTKPPGNGNVSNVYRIYASVKSGPCFDGFKQEKEYEPGIGSADDINFFDKAKAGVFGKGYKDLIRTVYKRCCSLEETDEVWLFGFSRGAYIVRAVAGLLHHIGVLQSSKNDFDSAYAKVLRDYVKVENRLEIGKGQLHHFGSSQRRAPPQIRFVGVFDTVKAVDDAGTHDISFNRSTQHFRHALALNEDRKHMKPKYEFPDFHKTKSSLSTRSFIQAWFVGAHIDIGGSSKRDGLALYPFQWILGEAQSKGLVLEFEKLQSSWSGIDDPLCVVFPKTEQDGKGYDMWTCTTKNGICVRMQDLRAVHRLPKYEGRYSIKINSRDQFYWPRKAREIFNADGELRGYCGWAPQGTIIHPSVYQCLEAFIAQTSSLSKMPDRLKVEAWRARMLRTEQHVPNQGFWSDGTSLETDNLKAIRILVCGNTGVGKSTLINRVFGVEPGSEVTGISDRDRGKHNVQDPIIHENRADLIIHDSGGFEAGDKSQMRAVGQFVREMSLKPHLEDRLHVIWFCIEMTSDRTKQTATEDLFKAVSEYTAEVPVIVIATKMDNFRGTQREEKRQQLEPTTDKSSLRDMVNLDNACTDFALNQIGKRLDSIEREIGSLDKGHFDACVAVARNDRDSLDRLNRVTLENVKDDKLRLLYIATQTASINLKIDAAVGEVMQVYRTVLSTASGSSFIPIASSANRAASAIKICKAVVQCFGLPTINYETVLEIVKNTVWDDASHNMLIAFSEIVATAGVVGTVGSGGMPFFLLAGPINFPLVVPATTRLILMLATDLILILIRAFKITTTTCVGQPQENDVARAARDYQRISGNVHAKIFKLVPRRNVIKSFRYSKVRLGFERIINEFKEVVTKDSIQDERISLDDRTMMDEEVKETRKLAVEARKELYDNPSQTKEMIAAKLSSQRPAKGDLEKMTTELILESPDDSDESDDWAEATEK